MSEAESEVQGRDPPEQPVERLLGVFGGVQALARALDVPAATVEEWRARGSIPRERLPAIAEAAARESLDLDPATLAAAARAAPTIDAEAALPAPAAPAVERARPRWFARGSSQLPAMAFGALLVVAGFLLAMGTSSLWLEPPADLSKQVKALEAQAAPALETLNAQAAQLEQLQQRVADLQQQLQALPAGIDRAAMNDLARQILAEVDRRLAAAPQGDPARLTALEQGLAELNQKIDALAQQRQEAPQVSAAPAPEAPAPAPAPAADTAAIATAVQALARRVAAGEPYATELGALETLATDRPEILEPLAALRAGANAGIATLDALRGELAALAPHILRAARGSEDGDVLEGIEADLLLLLGGRPVGEAEGDSVDARVARAELRLEEGDLAAALAELQALTGAAAEAAQPWRERAEARLAALDAAAKLQQLAASGG